MCCDFDFEQYSTFIPSSSLFTTQPPDKTKNDRDKVSLPVTFRLPKLIKMEEKEETNARGVSGQYQNLTEDISLTREQRRERL